MVDSASNREQEDKHFMVCPTPPFTSFIHSHKVNIPFVDNFQLLKGIQRMYDRGSLIRVGANLLMILYMYWK